MRKIFAWACILAWAALCLNIGNAAAAKKKKSAKKSSPTAASKKAGKAGSKKAAASSKRGKKGAVRTTWRNRQTAPTPERYKEIQNALAAKGYLAPEDASGVWTQRSTDALKKFQADQNLDSNGKINSLSLIALGLGPKREAPPPPVQPQEVPAALPNR